MKMRAMAHVFGLMLLASVSSSPDAAASQTLDLRLGVALAGADEGGAQCVRFGRSEADKTIVYEVENTCDRQQACAMSWLVNCEDQARNVTTSSRKSTRFAIAPAAKHSVSISAESCKQGWRIDDVSWTCGDTS